MREPFRHTGLTVEPSGFSDRGLVAASDESRRLGFSGMFPRRAHGDHAWFGSTLRADTCRYTSIPYLHEYDQNAYRSACYGLRRSSVTAVAAWRRFLVDLIDRADLSERVSPRAAFAPLFFAFCLPSLVTPAPADDETINVDSFLTADNLDRLNEGEVLLTSQSFPTADGSMRARGVAVALVNRPAADVWSYLPDFENYPVFMPRLVSAKTYRKEGNVVGVEFKLKVLLTTVTYSLLHTIDPERGVLVLRLDTSREHDIRDTSGQWLVRPHGADQTLLAHSVVLDTGFAVPRVIEDYLTKRDLPNVVRAMKRRIESAGAFVR
jgi:coenzyme Q-binding protein COQ10